MSNKRLLITAIVVLLVLGLAYLQFREWRHFDWGKLFDPRNRPRGWFLVAGAIFIYFDYLLRAFRWKLFLKPVCDVDWRRLIAPTMIGFAGVALLGRPGEFVRPYAIARKECLSMSSQTAVWAVERLFDTGAFTILVGLDLLFSSSLWSLPHYAAFRNAGFLLLGGVAAASLFMVFLYRKAEEMACWVESRFSHAPHVGAKIALRIREFGIGLRTIHSVGHFFQLVLVSIAVWLVIAAAYLQVVHAYPGRLSNLEIPHVLLLMGSAMVGSVLQLPAVGGGSQLATISMLHYVFGISPELATSCGIMLWLVTFMTVIPAGLILARIEHVSLREATHVSQEPPAPGPPQAAG